MDALIGIVILVVLGFPLWFWIRRSNELFCLDVKNGEVSVVRGRMPQRLLDDLVDVLERGKKESARIRVVVEDGRPRVVLGGGSLSETRLQQVRNVVGTYKLAQIKAGGRTKQG
jgi:hypothetical protein